MVRKLFNDLITALDIIPSNPTVDLCVQHPSTCALTGKVRIITKRSCVYKSLVLTVTGTARVGFRQGSRPIKDKQVFLEVSKEIVFKNPSSSSPLTDTIRRRNSPLRTPAHSASRLELNGSPHSDNLTEQSSPSSPFTQNQLEEGVNDVDFSIEFPSHVPSGVNPLSTSSDEDKLISLPSGPFKTTASDSSVIYTLSATLVLSRKDVLVNNQMSASVPFRVQNWQDTIDWPHSEDHSYHGMRRGVIEYQLQVPKQLDSKRLQDLQFGFQASWRTEQDAIKVKEIEYYIIEEEQQLFLSMASPVISSTVISTSAIHDCSGYSVSTNDWSEMRAAARLQIPQPNTVQERTALPVPNTLSIEHKLRILIRFDQTLSKERDLQLSFAIRIHPTLEEDGSPVHPGAHITQRSQRRRRRRQSALYGFDTRGLGDLGSEDGESDDEHFPLPMYADREGTLLLMVGEESPEASGLVAGQIEPSGISMTRSFADGITMRSPSETLISSQHNSPLSSNDLSSFPTGNMPVQGEQHAWAVINRRYSLVPPSSEQMAHPGSRTLRRHSSFYARSNGGDQPPPYVLPPMAEESLRSYISSTHGSGSEAPPVLPAAQVSRADQLGSPARPSTSVNPLPSPPYEIHEEPLSFRMGARVGDQSFASRSSPPSSLSASPSSSLPSPTPSNTNTNSRQTPNPNFRQTPNPNSRQAPNTNSPQAPNTNSRQRSNTNPRQTSNASHGFRLVEMLNSGVGGGDNFAYSPGNW